jgi:hypothetical protein
MIRVVFFACLLLCCLKAKAQAPTVLNQKDAKGKPQGQWLIQEPARMGEDAYSEWGTFDHGTRTGTWYRFDGEGEITSIQHYRLGALDGEAKYFEHGRLICVGHYRGLNPGRAFDTIYVMDPVTQIESRRVIPADRGTVRHGLWQYYDENTGRLVREIDYVVDEVIWRQDFAMAPIDSAYYKRREAAMPHNQKHYYKPPRDKQVHYTDFH